MWIIIIEDAHNMRLQERYGLHGNYTTADDDSP